MSRRYMRDISDLDVFESEQIAITRELDKQEGSEAVFVKDMILRLSGVHSLIRMSAGLPVWQRAAYEAHQIARKSGTAPERIIALELWRICLLYTSPSPRDRTRSRMPSSA